MTGYAVIPVPVTETLPPPRTPLIGPVFEGVTDAWKAAGHATYLIGELGLPIEQHLVYVVDGLIWRYE